MPWRKLFHAKVLLREPRTIFTVIRLFFATICSRSHQRLFQFGELVLDPFCGGGTTLLEAISLGRRAAGMDVSALATFIARTKTTPLSVHDRRAISDWLCGFVGMSRCFHMPCLGFVAMTPNTMNGICQKRRSCFSHGRSIELHGSRNPVSKTSRA